MQDWEDDLIAMKLNEMIEEQTKNRVIDAKIANPVIEEKQTTTKTSQPTTTQDRMMWNMQRIGANTAQSRGYWGAGIKIAVLDTGISTHNDLVVYGGASFIPGTSSYNDRNGHGTHCAGVIGSRINNRGLMGVAPLSRLYAVKVLNDSGSGNFSWILSGMAWALRNKMNVVTMSLGAPVPPNWALRRMVNILNQAGITVVAAAGNSNSARSNFPYVNTPANCQGVIAVGATNYYNRIAPFSSRGGNWNQVTLCAPGTNIISTFPTNSYRSLSGTSMACPHVAGAIALIKRRFPTASPAWIKQRLMSTARDLGAPGNDPTYGAGMLACDRIV
jgi:subtilisin family serine protease